MSLIRTPILGSGVAAAVGIAVLVGGGVGETVVVAYTNAFNAERDWD